MSRTRWGGGIRRVAVPYVAVLVVTLAAVALALGALPQSKAMPWRASSVELDGASHLADPLAVPCVGDGVSGPRLKTLLVRPAGAEASEDVGVAQVRRLAEAMRAADDVFSRAGLASGEDRHLRLVTSSGCQLDVDEISMAPAELASYAAFREAMLRRGYARTDRKYVAWVVDDTYCGVSAVRRDDQPGVANANNFGPSFARVDQPCWGLEASVEAHEIVHLLGGVQPSAPHASGTWHCADGYDRVCYDGSEVGRSQGGRQRGNAACPDPRSELELDCGFDDYFNARPPAGSYLARHWNTAMSRFLHRGPLPSQHDLASSADKAP